MDFGQGGAVRPAAVVVVAWAALRVAVFPFQGGVAGELAIALLGIVVGIRIFTLAQ